MNKLLVVSMFLVSCSFQASFKSNPTIYNASRGKAVYQSNCIGCHNQNPRLSGSVGPDIQNSNYELLERRLMFGDYPRGYKPKRSTRIMPTFPHLKEEIPSL